MKITILKLTAFAMLATASSVYASEDRAVQSLRGSTSASSDEDSADEELYWWDRDWSRRPNGQPWSVRSNGTPYSVRSDGSPWWNGNNGGGWWNGNNRNNLQTCRANCQCPGGEEYSHNTVNFPLFDIFVQIRISHANSILSSSSYVVWNSGGCQMNRCEANCECAGGKASSLD